jgi:peptide deformylase
LVAATGRTTAREGCLSVPEFIGETLRARKVTLRARDPETGGTFERPLRGFLAIAAQHEIDHTRGILFLDRLIHPREALRLRHAG